MRTASSRSEWVDLAADEIARAILWLASDEATYSTGAILDAAGGR